MSLRLQKVDLRSVGWQETTKQLADIEAGITNLEKVLVTPIESLTTTSIDGGGVFDVLMRATKMHLREEYDKQRIVGKEYATVYLGALSTVLQTSVQFLMNEQQTHKINAEIGLTRQKTVTELTLTDDSIPAGLGFNHIPAERVAIPPVTCYAKVVPDGACAAAAYEPGIIPVPTAILASTYLSGHFTEFLNLTVTFDRFISIIGNNIAGAFSLYYDGPSGGIVTVPLTLASFSSSEIIFSIPIGSVEPNTFYYRLAYITSTGTIITGVAGDVLAFDMPTGNLSQSTPQYSRYTSEVTGAVAPFSLKVSFDRGISVTGDPTTAFAFTNVGGGAPIVLSTSATDADSITFQTNTVIPAGVSLGISYDNTLCDIRNTAITEQLYETSSFSDLIPNNSTGVL